MGSIEIGLISAVVGGFVGLAGWLSGRDRRIARDAEWRGEVNSKLDTIMGIKTDVASLGATAADHAERIRAVESSAAQAHHRIDEINGRIADKK